MGKLRRERQKYHLLGVKSTNDASANVTENDEASKKQLQETSTVLSVPENLFAGIDISPDNLKQSVKDPDIRSVISKKSLSAGSVISKKEKRKLRHEAFLKSKKLNI
jgi:endo-beta-N-acetylglucosaminidase D